MWSILVRRHPKLHVRGYRRPAARAQQAPGGFLEQGAPPTIFSAAMLGQLDVVKAYAAAMPDTICCEGRTAFRSPRTRKLVEHRLSRFFSFSPRSALRRQRWQ